MARSIEEDERRMDYFLKKSGSSVEGSVKKSEGPKVSYSLNKKSQETTMSENNKSCHNDDHSLDRLSQYRQTSSIVMGQKKSRQIKSTLDVCGLAPVPEYDVCTSFGGMKSSDSIMSNNEEADNVE